MLRFKFNEWVLILKDNTFVCLFEVHCSNSQCCFNIEIHEPGFELGTPEALYVGVLPMRLSAPTYYSFYSNFESDILFSAFMFLITIFIFLFFKEKILRC